MSNRNCCIAAFVLVACFAASVSAQYGTYNTRGLLEKKLYFIDENGKTGDCTFWSLNLGKHSVTVLKELPGEGEVPLSAEVNFNFLSSLYIEGKGYGSRGKTDVDSKLAVPDGEGTKELEPEKIEYVFDYGARVKPSDGDVTDLILLPHKGEGQHIRRMLLRVYAYNAKYKELKFEKDVSIQAFSFSQAGIREALAASKK